MEQPFVQEFFYYIKTYKDVSDKTIINYKNDMNVFFGFTGNRYNVNGTTIRGYVAYLLEEKKDSRSTINRRLSSLKSYFNFMYNEGYLDRNPGDKIVFLKLEEAKEKSIPTQEEIFNVLNDVNHVRDRALLETIYSTGIREGELSKLNVENLDFENRFITILKAKNRKTRVIPISKMALKYLKAYMGSRKKGPLFLNNRGTRISEKGVYNIVVKYFDFPPHALRHAFATHAIQNSGNMKAVSEILGHSSITVTEKIYTHLGKEHLKVSYKDMKMERD